MAQCKVHPESPRLGAPRGGHCAARATRDLAAPRPPVAPPLPPATPGLGASGPERGCPLLRARRPGRAPLAAPSRDFLPAPLAPGCPAVWMLAGPGP